MVTGLAFLLTGWFTVPLSLLKVILLELGFENEMNQAEDSFFALLRKIFLKR